METKRENIKENSVILSLVTPSGNLTLGNYLGAIRNFVKLQDDNICYFGVSDLHAITIKKEPAKLRQASKEVLATYIACGMDPEKSTLFIQSMVPQHAQLNWILCSISYLGQLSRMTQFKAKSKKNEDNLNAALFTYPVLMAADILLYQTDYVPVGSDQVQHLEFARDIAERFNQRYSPTFTVPDAFLPEDAARVMSLKDPSKKMSKSDEDVNAYILVKDEPDVIRRKIGRAITDSYGQIRYSEDQPGLMNLLNIYGALVERDPRAIADQYKDSSYADFKHDLGERIVEKMDPIRLRFNKIMADKDYLASVYHEGAIQARKVAQRTLSKVMRKVGFVQDKRL